MGADANGVSRYHQRYEDIIAGLGVNIDPGRVERFLHPEDCLEVLGVPKCWLKMMNQKELEERKRFALITKDQFLMYSSYTQ